MAMPLRPPALELPDIGDLECRSVVKTIMFPEIGWPRQILEQPVTMLDVAGRPLAFIADPDIAATVLTGGDENFPKSDVYQRVLGSGTGSQSISVVSGAQWKRQRHVLAPLFRPHSVRSLVPIFLSSTNRFLDNWRAADQDSVIDASSTAIAITFEVIWRLMFGEAESAAAPAYVADAAQRIYRDQLASDVPTATKRLRETAAKARPPDHPLLPDNPFASAADGTRGSQPHLDRDEKRDNARLLLGAGHETSAIVVSWALWLLGQDPDTQRRVHAELDTVLGGQPIQARHIEALPFLQSVADESMRLYPPGALTVRRAAHSVTINGFDFAQDTLLAVSFFALHRHKRLWRDPDAFLPVRFQEPDRQAIHPFAFLPFGAGPHACFGATLGRAEVLTILAAVLSEFSVTALDPQVRPRMLIAMRPDREVYLRVERRRSAGGPTP
jgi:cytochrome P450